MDERLIEVQDRFVDGIARVSELMGFSDAMGRIYGLLYLNPGPLSLDDICDRLSLTKGTVSLYLSQLEDKGVISRVSVRNTRKKYYEIKSDVWKVMSDNLQQRFREKLDISLSTADTTIELVEKNLSEMELEERNKASLMLQRLTVFKEFNLKVLKFFEVFLSEDKPEDRKEIRKIHIGG